jgi:hypothetical protein
LHGQTNPQEMAVDHSSSSQRRHELQGGKIVQITMHVKTPHLETSTSYDIFSLHDHHRTLISRQSESSSILTPCQ